MALKSLRSPSIEIGSAATSPLARTASAAAEKSWAPEESPTAAEESAR